MPDTLPAARVGDPVTHSAALWGLLEGALVGAALGAILVASGGTAAPLVIAGAMATGASLGGTVGKLWGSTQVVPTGAILTGSPNVYVNGKPAAFVGSLVSCNQHPGPQTIVEGSGSVEINGRRSARVGDRCSCGCVIAPAGSPDVSVGGPAVMPDGAAASEVPWYADASLFVLGLAGGGALLKVGGLGAGAIAAKLGGSLVGSELGGRGGRALGGQVFGEGSTGQTVLGVAGALVGGMGGDLTGGAAAGGAARAAEQAAIRQRVLANIEASRAARLGSEVAEAGASASESAPATRAFDYSRRFEEDLENFGPGARLHTGPLEDDLVLINYHDAAAELGTGRSVKWWTTVDQAHQFNTLDKAQQGLALPPDFGPRNAVSVARISAGTDVTFYEGTAAAQVSRKTGELYNGGAAQLRFRSFDPAWIVETRPIEPRPAPDHW